MTDRPLDGGAPREYGFDPACGSRLPAFYRANPYDDGQRTFYFCSEACRTYFLEHGQIQRVARPIRSDPGRTPCPDSTGSSSPRT
jgi:YHS domain-containing protein